VIIDLRANGNLAISYNQQPERRVNKRHVFNVRFPFKNVVMCPCGKPLTASYSRSKSGRRYGAYHCSRSHGRYAVSQRILEPAFVQLLSTLRLSEDARHRLKMVIRDAFGREGEARRRSRSIAMAQMDRLEAERNQFVAAFAQATSLVMRSDLERRVIDIQQQIDEARAAHAHPGTSESDLDRFLTYVERLMEHPAAFLADARNIREQIALYDLVFAERPTADRILNGTPILRPSFAMSGPFAAANSQLVNKHYQSWNTWQAEIERWQKAAWAIEAVTARLKEQQENTDSREAA
jgi:hypothetical protein